MVESQWTVQDLDACRKEIDAIDSEMITLLARRFEMARKIAAIKRTTAQPVVQRERQLEVERKYVNRGRQYALSDEFMVNLYHFIHDETCKMEEHVINESVVAPLDDRL